VELEKQNAHTYSLISDIHT